MKKKTMILSFPVLIFLLLTSGIFAQNQKKDVTIQYQQPPINKWGIEDLWHASISNNTLPKQNVNIKLHGTVEKKNEGLILDATSSKVIAYPGTFPIRSEQLKPVTTNYTNRKYEDIIRKTGTLPDGTYIICITVIDADDGKELSRDCIEQTIAVTSPPELTYPGNESTVKEERPVFQWMPPMPTPTGEYVTYTLKIWEILDNQQARTATEANPTFLKESIRSPYFQFPTDARSFKKNQNYAWQVTAYGKNYEIGKSQVWMFNTKQTYRIDLDSLKVICGGTNLYNFTLWFHNLNGPSFAGPNAIITSLQVQTNPVCGPVCAVTPPPTTAFPYSTTASYSITGTISCACNIFSVKLIVEMADQSDHLANKATTYLIDTIPPCSCCEDFIRIVDNLGVHKDSQLNYWLDGVVTAGPNPICQIRAEIASFSYHVIPINNPPNGTNVCNQCVWPPSKFGNFCNPVSPIGCLSPALTVISPYTYSREVIWKGNQCAVNHVLFHIPMILPDTNPLTGCCKDSIRMCIRFSFTDSACVTCDTLICFSFTRSPVSPVYIGYNGTGTDFLFHSAAEDQPEGNTAMIPARWIGFVLQDEQQKMTRR